MSQLDIKKFSKSPANLLYTEMVQNYQQEKRFSQPSHSPTPPPTHPLSHSVHQQEIHDMDVQIQKLIAPILLNLAEQVEIDHRLNRWQELTKEMTPEIKQNFRRKMDVFLWRIRTRLISACERDVCNAI